MKTIGLLSDTHGHLDDKFYQFFEPCDMLWHAGDIGSLELAQRIAAFKPLVGVYGNCDGQDIRHLHPSYQYFEREGMSVLMTHIPIRSEAMYVKKDRFSSSRRVCVY